MPNSHKTRSFLIVKIFRLTKFLRIFFNSLMTLLGIFCLTFNILISPRFSSSVLTKEPTTSRINTEDYELLALDSLLTGRLDLFKEQCDCAWAYKKNSDRCRYRYYSKCENICCNGFKAIKELEPSYTQLMKLKGQRRILLGVASSLKTCNPRVISIYQSWAQTKYLPKNTSVFFFYGADVKKSVLHFFIQNGIPIKSAVFLPGITDDQYPPVQKNMAMLNWLQNYFLKKEKWNWILKVDDDTLINWNSLLDFFVQFSPTQQSLYLGSRGFGRTHDVGRLGLLKPFCMGGPGYAFSDSLIRELPENAFPVCAEENKNRGDSRWHSDVIAGLCVYKHTRLGCWDRNADIVHMYDDKRRLFWHDYSQNGNYPHHLDAINLISLHPFKEAGSMVKLHSEMMSASEAMWQNATSI